jgi:DNA-binding winged helix-turn-helix (wHTH) protein
MQQSPIRTTTVRFGAFEVNAQSGELRKNGVKITLQEQPFRVLMLLLEGPGRIVTREELQQKLWPADTFVEFDRGLNTAINKVREVLGDSATAPRFIETIPRKGYRFLAPVEMAEWKAPLVESAPAPGSTYWSAGHRNRGPRVVAVPQSGSVFAPTRQEIRSRAGRPDCRFRSRDFRGRQTYSLYPG